jgi:hypothetical protein
MRTILSALLIGLVVACAYTSAGSVHVSPTPSPPATVGRLGAAGCQPASPSGAFPAEIYGTSKGGTSWAWFMAAYPPVVGIEDKTVWRLDGTKAAVSPTFTLIGPAGQPGRLNWGPDEHGGSSWGRPGREFGTGLVFPTPGCWDVHVTLDQLASDVYVVVES